MKFLLWKQALESRVEKIGLVVLYGLGMGIPAGLARFLGKHFFSNTSNKTQWRHFPPADDLKKMY